MRWTLALDVNEIQPDTAFAFPVRLPAILTLGQPFIALQVSLATSQTAGPHAFRFGCWGIFRVGLGGSLRLSHRKRAMLQGLRCGCRFGRRGPGHRMLVIARRICSRMRWC